VRRNSARSGAQQIVPDRIVVVSIPKLRLYGFDGKNGRITELLKILEKGSRDGLELLADSQIAIASLLPFPNSDRRF